MLRLLPSDELTRLPDDLCVIIPAHNEELLIGRCIRSVVAAGVAPHHVFVVNDGSTDGTLDAATRAADVNVLTNPTALGKLSAVRCGLAHFDLARRYKYVALLDADSHVAPDYFAEVFVRFMADPSVVLVCGAPHSERHNWLTAYRALEYAVTLRAFRSGQDVLGVITVAPGCASTYATRILDQLEWDSQTLVEDMDLTVQIHRQRLGRVVFVPHAVAYTQDPRTISHYVGQITRWYSGTWQVMLLRRLPFGKQRIDAEFALLTGEGLLYGALMLAIPLLLWLQPAAVLAWLLLDQALWLGLAVIFAVHGRRPDILFYFPAYLGIRVVNCVVLLRTFWLEVIRRKTRRQWFSVARYDSGPSAIHVRGV